MTKGDQMHSCDYCRPETAWAHATNWEMICGALEEPYPRPPVMMTAISAISSAVTVAFSVGFIRRLDAEFRHVGPGLGLGSALMLALAVVSLFVTFVAWWDYAKKTDSRYLCQDAAIRYANGYRKCFAAWETDVGVRPETPSDARR